MSKILFAMVAAMLLVSMVSAGGYVMPVNTTTVKVYYITDTLRELYSYKVVELTENMTEAQFQAAFDNASPVFAGDINPDIRNSFPLKAYNLARDIYGNSP
jgi:hypothetical protein